MFETSLLCPFFKFIVPLCFLCDISYYAHDLLQLLYKCFSEHILQITYERITRRDKRVGKTRYNSNLCLYIGIYDHTHSLINTYTLNSFIIMNLRWFLNHQHVWGKNLSTINNIDSWFVLLESRLFVHLIFIIIFVALCYMCFVFVFASFVTLIRIFSSCAALIRFHLRIYFFCVHLVFFILGIYLLWARRLFFFDDPPSPSVNYMFIGCLFRLVIHVVLLKPCAAITWDFSGYKHMGGLILSARWNLCAPHSIVPPIFNWLNQTMSEINYFNHAEILIARFFLLFSLHLRIQTWIFFLWIHEQEKLRYFFLMNFVCFSFILKSTRFPIVRFIVCKRIAAAKCQHVLHAYKYANVTVLFAWKSWNSKCNDVHEANCPSYIFSLTVLSLCTASISNGLLSYIL